MKTAKEWLHTLASASSVELDDWRLIDVEYVKQIQLDAMKEVADIGYTAATANVNPQSTSTAVMLVLSTAGIAKKAILDYADKRTQTISNKTNQI